MADYTNGRLHGVWLDASLPIGELHSRISSMLLNSVEPGAEEWVIHDSQGFNPPIEPHTTLEEVKEQLLAMDCWQISRDATIWASP